MHSIIPTKTCIICNNPSTRPAPETRKTSKFHPKHKYDLSTTTSSFPFHVPYHLSTKSPSYHHTSPINHLNPPFTYINNYKSNLFISSVSISLSLYLVLSLRTSFQKMHHTFSYCLFQEGWHCGKFK